MAGAAHECSFTALSKHGRPKGDFWQASLYKGARPDRPAESTLGPTLEPGRLCMLTEVGSALPASSGGSLSVCRLTVSVLWMLLSLGWRPLEISMPDTGPPEANCCCTNKPWKRINAQLSLRVHTMSAGRARGLKLAAMPCLVLRLHGTCRVKGQGSMHR